MSTNNLNFRGQREGEKVQLLIRRHPFALAKPGLKVALALSAVILGFVWLGASQPAVYFAFIVGLVAIAYTLYAWFTWWNTLYLLTDERVIVITQRGLWSRRIEDYNLEKIQSVASDTDGPAGTLLNFGTVTLAIMGIKEPVALPCVEAPYDTQEKILSAMKRLEAHWPLNHEPSHEPKISHKRSMR